MISARHIQMRRARCDSATTFSAARIGAGTAAVAYATAEPGSGSAGSRAISIERNASGDRGRAK